MFVTAVNAVNVTVVGAVFMLSVVVAAIHGAVLPDSKVAIAHDSTERALNIEFDIVAVVSCVSGYTRL